MNRLLFHLALAACVAACAPRADESAPSAAADSAPTSSPATPATAVAEPGSPHGAPRGADAQVTADGATLATPHFAFDLPASWRREQPSSSMRLAQAVVPGDAGPGELAVFYFGAGQGGTVEGNFERWSAQIEGKPGSAPARGVVEGQGFRASWIDLEGTLLPTGMGGPTTPQPDFRLIGAVVEGESGPYFFKLTGPATTIEKERDAFLALLASCRRSG